MMMLRRSVGAGVGATGSNGGLAAINADGGVLAPPAALASEGTLPANRAAQQAGNLLVILSLSPYPPRGGQASTFEVTLADASGQPVSDATISLNLTMPAMWMPPNQFSLQPASNGRYSGSGRFTMRGEWRIEVVIQRGGQTQPVYFRVWL